MAGVVLLPAGLLLALVLLPLEQWPFQISSRALAVSLSWQGIALLALVLLFCMAIPLVFSGLWLLAQRQRVLQRWRAEGDPFLHTAHTGWWQPLLQACGQRLAAQELELIALRERNELFADALDEINDISLQLRRSERRWALALEATGDGIWEWDAEHDQWYFSSRWKSMLGYAEHELADELASWHGLLHPDDLDAVKSQFLQYVQIRPLEGERILALEYRLRHQDGGWRVLVCHGVADRDVSGRVIRVVGAQADVTTQRQFTAELAQAKEEAEAALGHLRRAQQQMIESEKLAALGALVAGVSHEVNTPLGIALTAASTLDTETHTLQQQLEEGHLKKSDLQHYATVARDAATLILRHCDHAAALIRSFKNISVDQTAAVVREFVLGDYLEEILQSLRPTLRKTAHQIALSCPAAIQLRADPSAFTQIINNLVNNAILHAFTPEQAGQIQISVQELSSTVLELRFQDNGRGIEPAARAKVFEPFYTTKRGQGGSGLGMSIVHNLVVAHLKGSIHIEETPGGGACFVIQFPRYGLGSTTQ